MKAPHAGEHVVDHVSRYAVSGDGEESHGLAGDTQLFCYGFQVFIAAALEVGRQIDDGNIAIAGILGARCIPAFRFRTKLLFPLERVKTVGFGLVDGRRECTHDECPTVLVFTVKRINTHDHCVVRAMAQNSCHPIIKSRGQERVFLWLPAQRHGRTAE